MTKKGAVEGLSKATLEGREVVRDWWIPVWLVVAKRASLVIIGCIVTLCVDFGAAKGGLAFSKHRISQTV